MLQDPPVSSKISSRADLSNEAVVAYRARIEKNQEAVKQQLVSRNINVTGSVSVLINAIFVATTADRVDEMRAIPGVANVQPMRKFKKKLDRATTIMNGPAAWAALGGVSNAGLGMKIAILDTGIDQTHPMFQDPSLPMPAGFPLCTTRHPEDCAYTTNKVIVAKSYVRLLSAGSNPANPAVDDEPDDYSPRDRDGHGTGVASSAAGIATVSPGVSSTGGAITLQGMAPKAYLGNYRISGSPGVAEGGSDQTLIQACEDAFADGFDVITTSFGSNALTNAAADPSAAAFEAAAKAGAIVLAAAGNSGEDPYFSGGYYPGFNTISSPSNAPDVISVGATENSHVMFPSVTVNGANVPSSLTGIPAQPSDAYAYPATNGGANTATLVDITSLDPTGLACGALPANSLNGVYVLIERGTCTFDTKATNAENAGAIGVIIYWADSTAVTPISGVGFNNMGDAAFIGPLVAISNAAGVALKSFIDANPGRTVTIAPGETEVDAATWSSNLGYSPVVGPTQVTGFSSFGPTPDGQLKPDVVAVGGNDINFLYPDLDDPYILAPSGVFMATQSYDPNSGFEGSDYSADRYWSADGTSFATPLTAGAAALAKQAHPGLARPGTQIRSLIVNNAAQTITEDDIGDPVDAEWIGNGLVNAGAAVAASITSEPATISFGVLNTQKLPLSQALTITNIGKSSVTLSASISCCMVNASPGSLSNATLALSQSSFTLAAGAAATLTVTLSGSAPPASEYSGSVLLQQGGTVVSQIPFMILESDGVAYNANPISLGGEGAPGEDIGPVIVQVTDQYGISVPNSPVTFTVSPRGGVTFKSVSGEPACTVSGANATCNTDQFGFAWAEVIDGTRVQTATISTTIAGNELEGSVNIQATPNITGVADAASGSTTIAPGSYIAIYGTGLSNYTDANSTVYNPNSTPTTEATDPVIANGAVLPLQIDLVTVSFDVPSAGISVPGHLTYVSPTQVNVQVPWELQGQSSVQIKVTLDGDLLGNVVTVPVANAVPEFFTYNNIAIGTDTVAFNLLAASNAAKRGSTIVLYANGLGPVNNQPASGDPAGASPLSTMISLPAVMIGGQSAQVVYAGLVPSLPGLYQLNVVVPSGISAGTQNVTVTAGGVTSATATLPVQ